MESVGILREIAPLNMYFIKINSEAIANNNPG